MIFYARNNNNLRGAIKFSVITLVFLGLVLLGGVVWLKNFVSQPKITQQSTNNKTVSENNQSNKQSENIPPNSEKSNNLYSATKSSAPAKKDSRNNNPKNLASTGAEDIFPQIFGILSFLVFCYMLREYFLARKNFDEKILARVNDFINDHQ